MSDHHAWRRALTTFELQLDLLDCGATTASVALPALPADARLGPLPVELLARARALRDRSLLLLAQGSNDLAAVAAQIRLLDVVPQSRANRSLLDVTG